MKFEVDLNAPKAATVMVLVLLGAGLGYCGAKATQETSIQATECIGLDVNTAAELTFIGGHCERLGLVSSIFVQQDINGNAYGVPICVQQTN